MQTTGFEISYSKDDCISAVKSRVAGNTTPLSLKNLNNQIFHKLDRRWVWSF